jgi:hypothetical protein
MHGSGNKHLLKGVIAPAVPYGSDAAILESEPRALRDFFDLALSGPGTLLAIVH